MDRESHSRIGNIRWTLPLAMMFPVFVAYVGRLNISFAIPDMGREYGWTVREIGKYGGFLMSIFYLSYGLSSIFLSRPGGKAGPRKSLILVTISFSLFTVLCAPLGMSFGALVAMRLLVGAGQGILFPMLNVLVKNWFPVGERSRANGIFCTAAFLPMVIAPFFMNPLVGNAGWRAAFIYTGAAGCVFAIIPIIFLIYNHPASHPRISKDEISFIEAGKENDEVQETGWRGIKKVTDLKTYRLMIIAGTLSNAIDFGLMSWFPIYLAQGRGLSSTELSLGTSIPFVFSIFGILLWGYIGDKSNKRGYITAVGFWVAGLLLALASRTVSANWSILLFSAAIFIKSSWTPHEFSFIQLIMPKNQTDIGTGLYIGIAVMLGGGLGPALVGGLLSATGSFDAALFSLVGVSFFGGIVMFIVGKLLDY